MLFRLVRPVRRKHSRVPYFVQRVPSDVRARLTHDVRLHVPLGERTLSVLLKASQPDVRFSLRATDPAEVKKRHAAAAACLEAVWQALRQDAPATLTHRQSVALAGELYRAWADHEDREQRTGVEHDPDFLFPGEHITKRMPDGSVVATAWRRISVLRIEPAEWQAIIDAMDGLKGHRVDPLGQPPGVTESVDSLRLAPDLEKPFGALLDRLLLSKGIYRIDLPSREMVLTELWSGLRDAFEHRKRNSESDYAPDPKAVRFPAWEAPTATRPVLAPAVSLKGLMDDWWKEARATGRKPSTYESYSRTMATFADFLGHDDASRVSRDDVVRFKDHRLASTNQRNGRPISPRTVKDTDLAGLKSVLGWARANGKIASNPAEGVSLQKLRPRQPRRGFTELEAEAILSAASRVAPGREHSETLSAKRWVPWLLAYTGARVGEVAQLRKVDVKRIGEHWTLTITPEAGTVKTDRPRTIVLHAHLVELGFPKFVTAAKDGALFLRIQSGGNVLGPLKALKNRLREFVRDVVSDSTVDPNHGWRHRFKTVCREAGIDAEVRDHIQGHAPRTVGERYGEMPLKAQAVEIAKLPRYEPTKRPVS